MINPNRQKNQYKILQSEDELTEGAERLLSLIEKYEHVYNVTNQQYAYLMGISLRNTVKYFTELLQKKRIEVYPQSRKFGRGKANKYRIIRLEENVSQEDN